MTLGSGKKGLGRTWKDETRDKKKRGEEEGNRDKKETTLEVIYGGKLRPKNQSLGSGIRVWVISKKKKKKTGRE